MHDNELSELKLDDWDKVYTRFRDQIEHENNLYNQRILWLIYIQALLFATLGLMTRARIDEPENLAIVAVDLMITVICFLGMFIGAVSRRVLDNAGQALDEVRDHWNSEVAPLIPTTYEAIFPHVSGGLGTVRTVKKSRDQSDPNAKKTFLRSRYLPVSFVVAWFSIFVIVAVGWFPESASWLLRGAS